MEEKYIGRYIEILSDGIKYKGFVKAVNKKDMKIVLKKVINCDNGSKLRNDRHFFGGQIQDLKMLDDAPPDIKNEEDAGQAKSNTVKKTAVEQKDFLDASDNGPSLFQLGHLQPNLYLSGMPSGEPQVSELNKPPDAMMIDKIDIQYVNAVTDIRSQKVISFIADGQKVNRFEEISLVTIGTRNMVYLFDLHAIGGNNFFANGMQNILENPDILKVIHDVRLLSDCLKAKYKVLPVNIFDTQVADAFIYKNLHGKFPEEVSSLTDCFVNHLNLSQKECTFEKGKKRILKGNINFWTARPVDMKFQMLCAKMAVYLRELRTVMLEKLLAEYLHGVDIYLKTIAEKADNAAKYTSLRRFPEQFKIFTSDRKFWEGARRKSRQKRNNDTNDDGDDSDYKDDSSRRQQRSAWDTGTEFSEQYHKRHGEIIEILDQKSPLIDRSKPLLRTKNSPAVDRKLRADDKHETETVRNSPAHSVTLQDSNIELDKCSLFPTKAHTSQYPSYVDEFQFSASESQEDDFLTDDSIPRHSQYIERDHLAEKSQPQTVPSTQRVPRITDSAKRMILQNITPSNHENTRKSDGYNSDLSSSSATSLYHNEFPSLSQLQKQLPTTERQNVNKTVYDESLSYSPCFTVPFGVKSTEEKKAPRGRGQILKSLTQHCRADMTSPMSNGGFASKTNNTLGNGNGVYEFPPDEELLEMPHVTPQVNGATVVGERINVLKKFAKE